MARSAVVPISLASLERDLGVLRDAASRGLKALEAAGLVEVERHPGRRPVVTILDTSEDDAGHA
jgi:DNA-binding MarR family transcriptional regulator